MLAEKVYFFWTIVAMTGFRTHPEHTPRRNTFFAPVTLPPEGLCAKIVFILTEEGDVGDGPRLRLSQGGRAHDLRSPYLYLAPWGRRGRIRRAFCQAAAPAGETLQVRSLLAHGVRSAQSSHPRLSLRGPATPGGRPCRAGPRPGAPAAPRRGG